MKNLILLSFVFLLLIGCAGNSPLAPEGDVNFRKKIEIPTHTLRVGENILYRLQARGGQVPFSSFGLATGGEMEMGEVWLEIFSDPDFSKPWAAFKLKLEDLTWFNLSLGNTFGVPEEKVISVQLRAEITSVTPGSTARAWAKILPEGGENQLVAP